MAQRILNVRVRPFRMAVLLAKTASPDEVLLALRFLSYLWGGRFCQLLAVETGGDDPLASFRLSQSRPDLVYGIGIDQNAWRPRVHEACQPRGFGMLEAQYVENLHDAVVEPVTAAHVVHHLRRTPEGPGRQQRTLRLLGCDPKSPLRPFAAALFGIHYENLGSAIPNEGGWLPEDGTVADLIATHADLVSKYQRCWLDLASHGLVFSYNPFSASSPPPPTVVLVGELASDMSLFWNLRTAAEPHFPAWVIPLPAASAADPAVLAGLRDWLLAFEIYRRRPTFCRVTSATVSHPALAAFAGRLREALAGTAVKHVDAWEPTNRLPVVVPYESERHLPVELSRRTLTFHPPRPKLLEGFSKGAWLVEFREDVRRGRAVRELCLPPRISTFAVLNAPGPTSIPMTRIPQLGDGVDGINIVCWERKEFARVHLPTAEEVLTEVLREAEITPTEDEKRACYLPVLRMFGGLDKAAEAFSGQRGNVLKSLLDEPLHLGEIQGKARLGKGKLAELAEPEVPRVMLDRLDPVAKRTFRRRRRRLWTRMSPSTTAVESLLEFWADRGVVSRRWQLGPCPACMGSFWEGHIDISKPVLCPGCGRRLRLPPQVPMGYSIHRLVGHAIRQGIVPVVLAGRFLKNLTHRGFLWVPGVKYKWDDKDGDLDILACCDGHIVVGECKTLDGTPADTGFWEVILGQFAETIKVGKACKASFAVLAVMADGYPADFQEKADALAGPAMRCLLLDKQDLEQGQRSVKEEVAGFPQHLSLRDLIVEPMPETPRLQPAEAREVHTPVFSITY